MKSSYRITTFKVLSAIVQHRISDNNPYPEDQASQRAIGDIVYNLENLLNKLNKGG